MNGKLCKAFFSFGGRGGGGQGYLKKLLKTIYRKKKNWVNQVTYLQDTNGNTITHTLCTSY